MKQIYNLSVIRQSIDLYFFHLEWLSFFTRFIFSPFLLFLEKKDKWCKKFKKEQILSIRSISITSN